MKRLDVWDRLTRMLVAASMLATVLTMQPAQAVTQAYEPAGSWPAVTWHLKTPHGSATDAVGNVYVADTGNNRIVKFDVSGRYVMSWGGLGSDDGKFNQPWDVACDPSGTTVFVADTMNHRIQQFAVNGRQYSFVRKWGTKGGQDFTGTNAGEFNEPRGLALDSGGNVYVVDTVNDRIQKFAVTESGVKNLKQWGTSGSGVDLFLEPYAIDISATGWVYVLDREPTN